MARNSALLAAALTAGLALSSSPAQAERLSGQSDSGGMCGHAGAEVLQWTPAAGPAASAIADAFLSNGGSLWMALGYHDGFFWSAEGYAADACDDCDDLNLVRTDLQGKRHSFPIVDRALREKAQGKPAPEYRTAIKGRIFTLAKNHWPVAEMQHDYKLALPEHDAEGTVSNFTGWMAQVSKPSKADTSGFLLRYAPVGLSHMCWCDQTWTAYTLAKPKK